MNPRRTAPVHSPRMRPISTLITILTTFFCCLLAQPAHAQPENVTVTATPQFSTVTPGQNMAVAVTFEFSNHFHIWPNKAEAPDGVKGLVPIPTTIKVADAHKPVVGIEPLTDIAVWPKGEEVTIKPGGEPIKIIAYENTTTVYIPVKVAQTTAKGPVTLTLTVHFQACDETTCLREEDVDVPVTFTIGDSVVPTDTALFTPFDPAIFSNAPAPPAPKPLSNPTAGSQADQYIDLGLGSKWRIPKGGVLGYTLLFLVAFLGGIILNLTPCVLPVIPLKILGLQAQAGSRSRMLYLGFIMFCGLVFFWLVIGALIAFGVLGAVSQISSYWQFNLAIAAFMAAMGLGMLGLFTVGLPTWVYNIDVKHDSVAGSFGFGIMSALLATPCVAPLAGGAMAAATKFSAPVALLIFLFIGIGMGLPYLILAAYPRLVSWIPRAGPGSELLKQVLGMLMVAISLFFLGTALITLTSNQPYIAKQLHWWAIALAVFVTCVWLVIRSWQITPSAVRRSTCLLVALLFAAGVFWWASSQTAQAKVEWARAEAARLKALANADPNANLLWQDFTAEKVDRFIADGKVVVMDFTAVWCIPCQVLKSTVLHTESVEAALSADHVRSFKVDLTSSQAPGWQRLEALEQKGVPTLAIIGPGFERPWISNAYTIGEVVEAIKQARGTPKTAAAPTAPGLANSTAKP